MRIIRLISLATLLIALTTQAQRLQVIDGDGYPIAYVCVTNERGALVGSTDAEGCLDDLKGNAVLNLSHIAFRDTTVRVSGQSDVRIVLQEVDFSLPVIEVKPKELAYVQTYYRMVYFDDEGPIYFRGGVIDNTYEFAKEKSQSKVRSLSRGKNGFLRFIISTLVGRYIDRFAQISKKNTYQKIIDWQKEGKLTLTDFDRNRQVISDTISVLGYIDFDSVAGTRTTSFDTWAYHNHIEATKAAAKAAAKGKQPKPKKAKYEVEESYYEVFNIDSDRRSRVDDFVMRQLQVTGRREGDDKQFMLLIQAYTTGRDYIDKKDYKQLRANNKVDMEIHELKQFEQAHQIPPLALDVQAQIDRLFEKELSK